MNIREIVNKQVEEELEEEEKTVKLQFDGRQYLIKFPTEFSEVLKLKRGDQVKIVMKIPEKGNTRKSKIRLEILP